jgi:hypothetical protein
MKIIILAVDVGVGCCLSETSVLLASPHGVTTQRSNINIITAVKTSNLNNFHSSSNINRVIKLRRTRQVAHEVLMWEVRKVYKTVVGKPERTSPLERHRHGWEGNIKVDFQ